MSHLSVGKSQGTLVFYIPKGPQERPQGCEDEG
jgi:hypothetical protein